MVCTGFRRLVLIRVLMGSLRFCGGITIVLRQLLQRYRFTKPRLTAVTSIFRCASALLEMIDLTCARITFLSQLFPLSPPPPLLSQYNLDVNENPRVGAGGLY